MGVRRHYGSSIVSGLLILGIAVSGCGSKQQPAAQSDAGASGTADTTQIAAAVGAGGAGTDSGKATGATARSPRVRPAATPPTSSQRIAANGGTGTARPPASPSPSAAAPPAPTPKSPPTVPATPAAAAPAAPAASSAGGLDQGPRAAASPVDPALAVRGKKLFGQKTCNTCHKMDVRLIGPPLGPVPRERTAAWMMAIIERPAEMTKQDPIARQLFQQYKVQMVLPSKVNSEDARALVEFIKGGGK